MAEDRISFVPKKASFGAQKKVPMHIGVLFPVAIGLLIVSAVIGGIVFFYKTRVTASSATLEESLARARDAFDPGLIEELVSTSKKIEAVKALLGQHRTLVPIFDFIEASTLKNVQFKDFSYQLSKEGTPTIAMSGVAESYATLSLQAGEFEKNRDVRSVKFSGLRLGIGGTVTFDVDMELNPAMLAYTAETQ